MIASVFLRREAPHAFRYATLSLDPVAGAGVMGYAVLRGRLEHAQPYCRRASQTR
jgi:hypothetical protein